MVNLSLVSKKGTSYSVVLPTGRVGMPSSFVFAFAKSGSTLLDRLIRDYCKRVEIPTFSLFGSAFEQGVSPAEILIDAKPSLEVEGCVYTGFRHYPANFKIDTGSAKCILLVRDPRDMIVSLYYSIAESHVALKGSGKFVKEREAVQNTAIDIFALERAQSYLNNFIRYQKNLDGDNLKVYRYEEVIYQKQQWLEDIIRYFSWPFNEHALLEVTAKHDIIPEGEDSSAHIRQVHPGNYKVKLQKSTILKIEEVLKDFLVEYNYELTS